MIRWVFAFLLTSGGAIACDMSGLRMGSEDGNAPSVFVSVDKIPLAKPFVIHLTVCTDTEITGLDLDAIMPVHQHGMNYRPTIAATGAGSYRVEGMLFHMPGHWELQVKFGQKGRSLTYTLPMNVK